MILRSSLKKLSRKFQFDFRRKHLIKFLRLIFIHKISLWRCIFTCHTGQISRNQFLTQEEGCVRTFRKSVVSDSKFAGIRKTALSVEPNISFKAQCSAAQFCRLLYRVIQQNLSKTFSFQLRTNADRPHGHDWNLSAVIGFDHCPHEHVLSNQFPVLFHYKIKFRDESFVRSKLI